MVSLVTAERQAFVGATGLPAVLGGARETPISHSLCARVVAAHGPLLIDDARADAVLRDHPAVEEHGVVAYLGVPLVGKGGEAYGAVCAIDSAPRSWSCGDVRELERVAADAASELDRRRAAEQALRRASAYQVQAELLSAIAGGAPLTAVLDLVVRRLQYERPDMIASVLLVDGAGRLRHGSAPDLPAAYSSLVDGIEIGPRVGSCGTAAHLGETVIVEDVETDPLWEGCKETRSHTACAPAGRCRSWTPTAGCSRPSPCTTRRRHDRTRPTGRCSSTRASSTTIAVEQTWARDRLRTSEARHRAMVETIVDGVITVDTTGTILAVNPAVERMFGYGASELLGQPLTILIPQRHQAGHRKGVGRASASPAYAPSQELRADGLRRDGSEFPISVAVGRAEEADGRRTFTAILKDVTHQVAIEDELRRSEQAQRRLAEEQTSLAAEHAALHRVATAVASESEPARVCELVAREIAQLLSLECATVSRFVRDDELLVMGRWAAPTSFAPTPGTRIRLTPDEVARIVRGAGGAALIDTEPRAALPYRHHIAAPIRVGGRAWGIVRAATNCPKGIDPRAIARLESFAELTQTAIANAEARAALAAQASTDPLTGLPNHRTFHDSLRDAVGLAQVARAPARAGAVRPRPLQGRQRHARAPRRRSRAGGDGAPPAAARRRRRARAGSAARSSRCSCRGSTPRARWSVRTCPGPRRWRAVRRARAAHDLRRDLRPRRGGDGRAAVRARGRRPLLGQGARPQRLREVLADQVEELSATERAERLERRQALTSLRVLARAIDARDPSTQRHSERVADLAARIATALGWSPDRVELLRDAGLVHDVGKIGTPDSILLKPGRLDHAEYEQIKEHAALGARMVDDVLLPEQVAWVRHHHERLDGRGYPDGLAGDHPAGRPHPRARGRVGRDDERPPVPGGAHDRRRPRRVPPPRGHALLRRGPAGPGAAAAPRRAARPPDARGVARRPSAARPPAPGRRAPGAGSCRSRSAG